MADDTPRVRVEERLKIKIGEVKNLPGRSHGAPTHRDPYCVLSLDQEEIFRTSTMERTLNPFFAEEFQFEVPRRFRFLSIYIFDRDNAKKQDKEVGKVAIKREYLHQYNNKDYWFSLRPVDADSEVQGKAYIELALEDSRKRLRVEPKPPDPDSSADHCPTKTRANLSRLSEYCKESIRFGSSKKSLSTVSTEPTLSRSESLKDNAQWSVRCKPPLHAMSDPADGDTSPAPTSVDYWSDPERHCTARTGPDIIRLRVRECLELTTKNKQCDPFATVTVFYSNGRQVEKRTKCKKKTCNPQFDEMFCFDVIIDADPKDKDGSRSRGVASEVRVTLWHDATTPVFLGEVRLRLQTPAPATSSAWYFLTSRNVTLSPGSTPPGTRLSELNNSAHGSMRLQLQYNVDYVFPLECYRRLEELFLKSVHQKPISSSAVYILGDIVTNKTDAAQPLVRLFIHNDLIVPIVKELADAEISALTDATTIFRGNTLVSKMMDEIMRLSGASFLRSVLQPTLLAVIAERKPCEIDPARVKPLSAVTANRLNLYEYVEKVFSAITSSYAQCPSVMCRLFDALRQCAAKHFPKNQEVRYSVVSSFIFLRFFAPAILGPRLFDLTTEHIDPQTNRTLTLISKTIQSLGNLVSSRSAQQVCKEEYMAELYHSFCTQRHVQAVRQFLEEISKITEPQSNKVQESNVFIKEGTMFKRSEITRDGSGSPRRRWAISGNSSPKRKLFRLTSNELTWSSVGGKSSTRRLSLSGVLAIETVDYPPADAPLGANNIFKIRHRERELLIQASNCVERAEWVRLLTALCRYTPSHSGQYTDGQWSCCTKSEEDAIGCGMSREEGEEWRLALRLDPARELQRLHTLLVQHTLLLDARMYRPQRENDNEEGAIEEDREAEAVTLRELQEVMYDLEHQHRKYKRSQARETKYGSKQAPIGDDNYLHLAGASATLEPATFIWGSERAGDTKTLPILPIPHAIHAVHTVSTADAATNTDPVSMTAHPETSDAADTSSGYMPMTPNDDEVPARPPKPPKPLCEYVDMEPRPPERRPKPDPQRKREHSDPNRCKEYELMSNFMSHTSDSPPPLVPPRTTPRKPAQVLYPKPNIDAKPKRTEDTPHDPVTESKGSDAADNSTYESRLSSKFDTISNDDSLLDELRKDTYCELKVCEDEPEVARGGIDSQESVNVKEKEDYGIFSRISIQRKSNPIKSQPSSYKPLKTSNSTSNVSESTPSTSLADRLTPSFFKKKPKPPEEAQSVSKCTKKEDNLIGKLTPRFGQSRLYGRGQSLELNPASGGNKRIARSATSASIPGGALDSVTVGNTKFLSLHRFGARGSVTGHSFTQSKEESVGPDARDDIRKDSLEYSEGVREEPRRALSLAPALCTTANSDIKL